MYIYLYSFTHVLILDTKSIGNSPRLENFPYMGFGHIHKKCCDNPFSVLAGMSISTLATLGSVKPLTVRLVISISKLESPLIKMKENTSNCPKNTLFTNDILFLPVSLRHGDDH